ncbi:transposase [Methanobacterium subterraneum]|uniref:Transposase n=1 Tax=Methanobacterium subterraneum TaxID=59277 RepID=A0A2H4VAF2_9EURY|nr:transposase [Methanobacterium subterraneum]AUB55067.1 transposase [Methanobacterium subterraneum]
MKHCLNYSKEDPNYILLEKIFKIIGSQKSRTIIASKGVKNVNMMILSIKIIFTAIFFNTTIEFVVSELKRDKKLQKFFKINEVPSALQISEFMSRFQPDTFVKITNSILMQTKPIKRRGKLTFIVDATPVDLDYNTKRKHRSKKYLKKQNLKWSYASSYGFYIGFKATIVIEHKSAIPVAILIHSGAPHDTKIFNEIMENLRKRRIIRKKDIIIFDRGYYKYENYQIGISKYKIVPLIFPKEKFKLQKLKDKLTYPLRVFKNKKTENQAKKLYETLTKTLIQKIENWKRYKPIRGKIEDFFKLCKSGLGLKKIHKYTPKSAEKTTILIVFLAGLITTLGYNSKTALQKLSES